MLSRRGLIGLLGAGVGATLPFAKSARAATIPAGFPNADNTGVPQGTELTPFSGSYRLDQDDQVAEGLLITGEVLVSGKNCVLRKSRIVADTPYHMVRSDGEGTFLMEDCELVGNGECINGTFGCGTYRRNNIQGFHNGFNLWSGSVVEANYVHDLLGYHDDPHYDAIECNGADNVVIRDNTLINDHEQTSALMLNNEFYSLSNWLIEGNLMIGGGYTMYIDPRKSDRAVRDISIIDNRFGKGQWGYTAFYGYRPDVWRGNVDVATGQPIAP